MDVPNPSDGSKDDRPKDDPPVCANAWFYLIIGVFVMVIGLMFALVAWRNYQQSGVEDAFFALTIPIAMRLFFLLGRLEVRLKRQAWFARWPRLGKTLRDILPPVVFIPFVVLADLDYSKP